MLRRHTPIAAAAILLCVTGASAQTTTAEDQAGQTTATENASEGAAENTTQAPAEYDAETVVAQINGKPLTLGMVIAMRQSLPEQYQQLPDEVLLNGLIQQMADQEMLAQAALEAGLEDVDFVRLALLNNRRSVLADAYMTRITLDRVTEDAIKAAYDEKYANIEPVPQVRAAHILVPEEEQAKALKAQLDGGADFAELAAEHGTDGTASRGGDLGWFEHGQMVPEFADAAFALQPGQISEPVQSPFGWHLIKLDGKRDRPAPALEEVRGEIISELAAAVQNELLTEMRGTSDISIEVGAAPAAAVRDDDLITE